mgnify:FL=1
MSTLKVDKIDPSSGTALEIGSSGDTMTVPSGAQLTVASGATIDVSACTLTPPATMPASSGANLTGFTASQMPAGSVIQLKHTSTSAVATTSTRIPHDDTIPQNTEGGQVMSLAITPTSATNKLVINVNTYASQQGAHEQVCSALFQDSTANALASMAFRGGDQGGDEHPCSFTHVMVAGTTSSTTFKVRVGSGHASYTTTFNGTGGSRIFGGSLSSSITIMEVVA